MKWNVIQNIAKKLKFITTRLSFYPVIVLIARTVEANGDNIKVFNCLCYEYVIKQVYESYRQFYNN